ncbi:uncharacterized protein [Choristoneura fumiferana]|uniref:uncharacterized protein n=1 Tax=Choristoneura fumiferana TaxID=7141 RepID=UPI003D155F75
MARVLEEEGGKVGLRISREKSEYFHTNPREKREDLKVVDLTPSTKGSINLNILSALSDTKHREEEIDIRVQSAFRFTAALHKILVSKLLRRRTKIRVYKTVIRPILMYGCEAWTLMLKEENKLLVAERRILRKILGPTQRDDGSWRIRKNREIEDPVSEPNVIGETKASRLRLLGHVERLGEDRAVKRAYLGRPSGRTLEGRGPERPFGPWGRRLARVGSRSQSVE